MVLTELVPQLIPYDPPRLFDVADVDRRTHVIFPPMAWLRQFPAIWSRAEFIEVDKLHGVYRMVDPRYPERGKPLKVVYHKGGAQISVPRTFLHDRAAKNGDVMQLLHAPSNPEWLFLRLERA